jgi:hypothetical protein
MSTTGEFVKQHPLKIICVFVALACGAGIYFLGTKITESTILLEQKVAEGSRLEANVNNAAQLSSQLEELTAVAQKIQARQIRASQLATNLQYFYRLETDSGVELIDLRQTSSGAAVKPSTGIGFFVAVKGEYAALIGFLQRIENGPHYCRVLTASMNGQSNDRSGPLTLNLTVELLGKP